MIFLKKIERRLEKFYIMAYMLNARQKYFAHAASCANRIAGECLKLTALTPLPPYSLNPDLLDLLYYMQATLAVTLVQNLLHFNQKKDNI